MQDSSVEQAGEKAIETGEELESDVSLIRGGPFLPGTTQVPSHLSAPMEPGEKNRVHRRASLAASRFIHCGATAPKPDVSCH